MKDIDLYNQEECFYGIAHAYILLVHSLSFDDLIQDLAANSPDPKAFSNEERYKDVYLEYQQLVDCCRIAKHFANYNLRKLYKNLCIYPQLRSRKCIESIIVNMHLGTNYRAAVQEVQRELRYIAKYELEDCYKYPQDVYEQIVDDPDFDILTILKEHIEDKAQERYIHLFSKLYTSLGCIIGNNIANSWKYARNYGHDKTIAEDIILIKEIKHESRRNSSKTGSSSAS